MSLGSNIGDRRRNLEQCIRLLREAGGLHIKEKASFYETKPVGYAHQRDFINTAVKIETSLSAFELLKIIKDIEKRMGRRRTFRNGPRIIDIDILLFGRQRINTDFLTIPHPRMGEREFVLSPLREIAPYLFGNKGVLAIDRYLSQGNIHI